MTEKFRTVTARGWTWLVAADATGVLGYAYFTQFRDRSAYRFTAEDSIYVREDVRGQGVGKALVAQLVEAATRAGFRQMIAVIGDFSECRFGWRACQSRFPAGRDAPRRRAEIRPVAGRCLHAATAWVRQRRHHGLTRKHHAVAQACNGIVLPYRVHLLLTDARHNPTHDLDRFPCRLYRQRGATRPWPGSAGARRRRPAEASGSATTAIVILGIVRWRVRRTPVRPGPAARLIARPVGLTCCASSTVHPDTDPTG